MPDASEKEILNTLFTEEKGEVILMEVGSRLKLEDDRHASGTRNEAK